MSTKRAPILTEEQYAAHQAQHGRKRVFEFVREKPASPVRFTAYLQPMGKPRMTRSDKWKERPCVLAYREWCDKLREAAPPLPDTPGVVEVAAYFEMPASWGKKKKQEMAGQPHRVKPDSDNILKGCCDALISADQTVWNMVITKRWDDGQGARMEIGVWE